MAAGLGAAGFEMALKLVTVTQTTVLKVDIPDELLTPEAIEEFEVMKFDIKADPDNLFRYVSMLYVKHFRTIGGVGIVGEDLKVDQLAQYHDILVEEVNEQ